MKKAYVFLADGFEEIEALAPVDILRRGGVEVTIVSVMETQFVETAHEVGIMADVVFEEVESFDDADMLVLPGGMPGASNLFAHKGLCRLLVKMNARQVLIAAICASPGVVLAPLGLLDGKRATCYPGFEKQFVNTEYTADLVTVDGNIVTACGPGAAMEFGYELLCQLGHANRAEELREGMMYNKLTNKL